MLFGTMTTITPTFRIRFFRMLLVAAAAATSLTPSASAWSNMPTTTTSSTSTNNKKYSPPTTTTANSSSRRAFLQSAAAVSSSSLAVLLVGGPTPANAAITTTTTTPDSLPSSSFTAAVAPIHNVGGDTVFGDESIIMAPKAHGTSATAVQSNLRYGVSNQLADRIVNFNRHFAELAGYAFEQTNFETVVMNSDGPVTFYDSVTGQPLFVAPIGRSKEDFLKESRVHGWPSFRQQEVVWDNVRVLKNSGETVSTTGSHLGHNLPDRQGNRYCINLVSIAGNPPPA